MDCKHHWLGESVCEHCGAFESEQLRARIAEVTRERDEARADYLACAEAVGIVYAPDTGPCFAGPVDAVVEHIREVMQRLIDVEVERDEARAEVERLRGVLLQYDTEKNGILNRAADRATELVLERDTLRAQVERLREAAGEVAQKLHARDRGTHRGLQWAYDAAKQLDAALAATDSVPGDKP